MEENKRKKRFELKPFLFETQDDEVVKRYMITDSLMPMTTANFFVEAKSMRKTSTGKQYASKLIVFLNFLDDCNLSYMEATNKHVESFLTQLIYGNLYNLKIKSIRVLQHCLYLKTVPIPQS
jgi:integrase/recombinase XerD